MVSISIFILLFQPLPCVVSVFNPPFPYIIFDFAYLSVFSFLFFFSFFLFSFFFYHDFPNPNLTSPLHLQVSKFQTQEECVKCQQQPPFFLKAQLGMLKVSFSNSIVAGLKSEVKVIMVSGLSTLMYHLQLFNWLQPTNQLILHIFLSRSLYF